MVIDTYTTEDARVQLSEYVEKVLQPVASVKHPLSIPQLDTPG